MSAVTTTIEDQIRQIESDWGGAFERHDLTTLDRLMADEYNFTDPLGQIRTKAETLEALATNEVQFESTNSDNVHVRVCGDTAVVTGRSTFRGRYKGWPVSGKYQYTDVLVRREGSWRAVNSHITALGTGALRLRFGRFVHGWLQYGLNLMS